MLKNLSPVNCLHLIFVGFWSPTYRGEKGSPVKFRRYPRSCNPAT